MKICAICGVAKPLEEFRKFGRSKDGRGSYCKPCDNDRKREWRANNADHVRAYHHEYQRAWRKANPDKVAAQSRRDDLKRKYGITTEKYDAMFEAQQGCCAICGGHEEDLQRKYRMSVDHCHTTGVVRGLLCSNCNTGLGLFGESESALLKAVAYLRRHRCS